MNVDELELNCWVRSEDPGGCFSIRISKTETVYDLQEAIKDEKSATFHDVDAPALSLYKPTAPELRPYRNNLSKLTLSDHAELLGEEEHELSKIFRERPPEDDIHVIVDAPSEIVCWSRGTALNDCFRLRVRADEDLVLLIPRLKDELNLRNVGHDRIHLYRISGDENQLRESLNKRGDGARIQGTLAMDFLGVPVLDPLRVIIEVSAIERISWLRAQPKPIDALRKYESIFLKVWRWERFEEIDIERNGIAEARDMRIPEFVMAFEQKLVRKPHLSPNTQMSDDVRAYFEDRIAENESPENIRYAGPSEVIHTAYIAHHEWQELWQPRGSCGRTFNEHTASSIFFDALLLSGVNRTATVIRKDEFWPITVVMKRRGDDELRRYCPRNDLLISNASLPRLLVVVSPGSMNSALVDDTRMLTTGAFIVRFANKFVSTFSQERDFVLCAISIGRHGSVARHTLFQIQNDEKVYFNVQYFSLNDSLSRVEFARTLYTLFSAECDEDQKQAGEDAVNELRDKIRRCDLRSMRTSTQTSQNNGNGRSGGSEDEDGDGDGFAELRAHGYEVKPEVVVDDSGGVWEPLSKMPDHIVTVYPRTNKEVIAKKVREGSNELEIFRLFDIIALKSDHVISVIDSFDRWLILPKMVTIHEYITFRSTRVFERKVSQVCLGVIKGLAYLHEHRIAHRDIKPGNLVVDNNFSPKIIHFDIAMRVKDDDEEVDDQCGTRGWMAHEVEKGLRHSPIRADRWACGRVILFLLDEFDKKDESLRAFAEDLVSHNPNQRPSQLEWERYLVPSLSDAGNVGNSDAQTSGLRQDRGVNGDDTATALNAKRQRHQ